VESIQIDRVSVQEAPAGSSVGIKVTDRCRKHDAVFRLSA
jgi:hypothetical protein